MYWLSGSNSLESINFKIVIHAQCLQALHGLYIFLASCTYLILTTTEQFEFHLFIPGEFPQISASILSLPLRHSFKPTYSAHLPITTNPAPSPVSTYHLPGFVLPLFPFSPTYDLSEEGSWPKMFPITSTDAAWLAKFLQHFLFCCRFQHLPLNNNVLLNNTENTCS